MFASTAAAAAAANECVCVCVCVSVFGAKEEIGRSSSGFMLKLQQGKNVLNPIKAIKYKLMWGRRNVNKIYFALIHRQQHLYHSFHFHYHHHAHPAMKNEVELSTFYGEMKLKNNFNDKFKRIYKAAPVVHLFPVFFLLLKNEWWRVTMMACVLSK